MPSRFYSTAGMPRLLTPAQRRHMAAVEEQANERAMNARPNEDPDAPSDFDRCTMSRFSVHRFASSGGRRCDFCGKTFDECRVKGRVS